MPQTKTKTAPVTRTQIEVVLESDDETPEKRKKVPWTFGRKKRRIYDTDSTESGIESPATTVSSPISEMTATPKRKVLKKSSQKKTSSSVRRSTLSDIPEDTGFHGSNLFDDFDVSDLVIGGERGSGDEVQTPEKKFKPTTFSTAKMATSKKRKKPIMNVKDAEKNRKKKGSKMFGDSSWDLAINKNVSIVLLRNR
jgi:hypothetical protein